MARTRRIRRLDGQQVADVSAKVRAGATRRRVIEVAKSVLTFGIVRPRPTVVDVVRGRDGILYKVVEPDRMGLVRSLLVVTLGTLWLCLALAASVWFVHLVLTGVPW